MAMKCMTCGKGVMYGHNVSHSKRRTRKIFKPNLHVARINLGGRSVKMKLCTKCLRMLKKGTIVEKEVTTSEVPQVATTA